MKRKIIKFLMPVGSPDSNDYIDIKLDVTDAPDYYVQEAIALDKIRRKTWKKNENS